MEQRWDMRGGGTLTLRQEGAQVQLWAERRRDDRGLYKVWLCGHGGGRLLLGTLAPEGNVLRLKRVLPLAELQRAGCWPLAWVEAPLAFSFSGGERWYQEAHPERLLRDPVLRGQIRGPMLCRKEREGFQLAAPFRTDGPVALDSLFCLARVESMDSKVHLVWSFDREGRPKVPDKKEKRGQD